MNAIHELSLGQTFLRDSDHTMWSYRGCGYPSPDEEYSAVAVDEEGCVWFLDPFELVTVAQPV